VAWSTSGNGPGTGESGEWEDGKRSASVWVGVRFVFVELPPPPSWLDEVEVEEVVLKILTYGIN
jgi:hypothetical protein